MSRVTRNRGVFVETEKPPKKNADLILYRSKQYKKYKKVMAQLEERNVTLNHPPGRIFTNLKGKTMRVIPCEKVSEIAEGFEDHVGRHVLKLVDGFGWMRAYVERKAQPGEMPACNVGKHAVQFHLKFMKLKKFEHATKMPSTHAAKRFLAKISKKGGGGYFFSFIKNSFFFFLFSIHATSDSTA